MKTFISVVAALVTFPILLVCLLILVTQAPFFDEYDLDEYDYIFDERCGGGACGDWGEA